ncbi:PX domain-containing protein kinase-like protein isoform X2 [Arctopsyche grandis]|uniref:PX domain-containing protein kinase-like protein isoform X2 n=1 Tax=Arctopsyche grandis TaxID=121162 RepID=UPI00406D7204
MSISVFASRQDGVLRLDDTLPLSCQILAAHTLDTHTEYCIKVQRGAVKNDSWSVSRRYNEFASLNAALHVENFPPKKIIGNMQPEFIAKRRNALQVSNIESNDGDYMMSWQTYGPDKILSERDMRMAFKSLMNLKHLFIDKIIFIRNLETGTYVVRKLHSGGSVRDLLYGTQYNCSFLSKYANPKQKKPFTTGQIVHYGYQILQALKYLHNRGLPYGHLHAGNVAIENQNVLLMDIENAIVGVPMYYREFLTEHRKINTMEAIDVYSFGHTLYEMTYGEPLQTSSTDDFPPHVSNDLLSILQILLSTTACKQGMPNIDTLLLHPFFNTGSSVSNRITVDETMQCYLKFPHQVKEELQNAARNIETRLKSDQKLVRMNRIQEILNSEEEIKKRRRKSKNAKKLSRSASVNGLSPTSMSGPSERSGSVASTVSTASSYTPPNIVDDSANSSGLVVPTLSAPASNQNRTALLDSICSFNKGKLNKAKKL